ncbi:MAG: BrnA antitoxin family protein [Burkholderiaceae bacterium]|jgi:uncharacterized protein (DUF4415 family)|nr:BrnA antitoxin family protein [Burkholderiaceae bacterium]
MPKLKAGTVIPTVAEDKAITAAARHDPDAKPLTDAQWKAAAPTVQRGRPKADVTKVPVKLRLDPDVLAVLRASGDGWQTRVNRILRERFALS